LGELRDVAAPAKDERHAADTFLPRRETGGSRELSDELASTLVASPRTDERHSTCAPLPIGDRCHEYVERFALKLAARQRTRDFATGRCIESGYGGAWIVEPRTTRRSAVAAESGSLTQLIEVEVIAVGITRIIPDAACPRPMRTVQLMPAPAGED
jgi:hypothetical protein